MTKRILAGALTAGLLGVTPLAVGTAAQADTTERATAITLTVGQDRIIYGDDTSFQVQVDGDGTGTVTLLAQPVGSSTPTAVASDVGVYSVTSFYDIKPKRNTVYYAQYADAAGTVTSAPVPVGVGRKLTIKNPRGTFIKGKVAPKYKRKKVILQKKVGGKYRKFRVLRTNKKSAFTVTLPAYRKRTYWRFVVKGGKQFETVSAGGSTIKYRSAARPSFR